MDEAELRKRMERCFGYMDRRFCTHHLDEQRAHVLKADMATHGLTLADAVRAATFVLQNRPAEQVKKGMAELTAEQVERQLVRVRAFF